MPCRGAGQEGLMGENIYRIFDGVWNLSLVGGYCVLLVILARLLLQKAPKWCSYLLWGIVFVRLCCPILPETGISLIPERLLSVGTEMTSGQSWLCRGQRYEGYRRCPAAGVRCRGSTGQPDGRKNDGWWK